MSDMILNREALDAVWPKCLWRRREEGLPWLGRWGVRHLVLCRIPSFPGQTMTPADRRQLNSTHANVLHLTASEGRADLSEEVLWQIFRARGHELVKVLQQQPNATARGSSGLVVCVACR